MKVVYLNPNPEDFLIKKVEVIKYNGKNYIEFTELETIENVIELAMSLARENEALKERVSILELKNFNNVNLG